MPLRALGHSLRPLAYAVNLLANCVLLPAEAVGSVLWRLSLPIGGMGIHSAIAPHA